MATKKQTKAQQHEELIQTLKFTPRTYQVVIGGYGGEIAMGKIDPKTVEYFKRHFVDVENYSYNCAEEGDDEYIAVPENLQPFSQGNWYDCDNIEHNSGAEFGGSWITVYDENGETVLEKELGHGLEDDGCAIECFCSEEIDDYVTDDTAVFVGQNFEKGTFFEADLELTQPFDISKFRFVYSQIAGWNVLNCVEYDGEDLDGSNGYSTTGKSSSFSFYYKDADGDVAEYSSPEYPAWQDGPCYYAEDWEKVEFKFGKRNRPATKGWYDCVWTGWGTSYGKLFWDGENWIEYEYGKPSQVDTVQKWSGLYWDTSDLANQPSKKPRKKKDAKPLTAKQVNPYPHGLNGQWPEELGLPEVSDDDDFTSFVNAVEAEVTAAQELEALRNSKEWNDADVKPSVKGEYEVKFAQATWPLGAIRNAEWTGRSWKEHGKKAPELLGWRDIEEE